ncbi:MAG: MBOAT family O-acyltransferase [Bacteroidota bacterium]
MIKKRIIFIDQFFYTKMLFNSIEFLIFFPFVFVLYYLISHSWRWVFLLAASYLFYMSWRPEYAFLIISSTLIDYFASHKISGANSRRVKNGYLLLSLFVNLGLLMSFKYMDFFGQSTVYLFNLFDVKLDIPTLNILLPVGISFYTFQTLSYTIDVYRGNTMPEKHLGKFALFVSFFPQLVAGPIERSKNLLPQIHKKHEFDYNQISSGLKLMLFGFFKKVVVADRIDIYITSIYNNPDGNQGWPIIIAAVLYYFQVYCDFSGYTDIAIGSARTMGFNLMKNFDRPYASKSLTEFWTRWHISLTTWLRDYIYYPLGGSRVKKLNLYLNIFIVFLISGLWHGASWNFVLWGAFLGIVQIIEKAVTSVTKSLKNRFVKYKSGKLWSLSCLVITFCIIAFSTLLFRSSDMTEIKNVLSNLIIFNSDATRELIKNPELILAIVFVIIMILIESIHSRYSITKYLSGRSVVLRYAIYISALFLILLFGVFSKNDFIYFQF